MPLQPTEKSLRRVLLDEFINEPESGFQRFAGAAPSDDDMVAVRRAEEFYERVLVGYGDDSVAELAGAHVAVEQTSTLAAKALEDSRTVLIDLELAEERSVVELDAKAVALFGRHVRVHIAEQMPSDLSLVGKLDAVFLGELAEIGHGAHGHDVVEIDSDLHSGVSREQSEGASAQRPDGTKVGLI